MGKRQSDDRRVKGVIGGRGEWRCEERDWKIKDRNRTGEEEWGKEECKRQEGDKIKQDGKRKREQKIFPSVFLLSGSAWARDRSVQEEMEKEDERGHEQRERWGLEWNRGERETGREDLSSRSPEICPISHRVIMIICPRLPPPPVCPLEPGHPCSSRPEKAFFKASIQVKLNLLSSSRKKDLYFEMNNTFPH